MFNLIKEAQEIKQRMQLIIETVTSLGIDTVLLERLDGVLQGYVQQINSGSMKNFNYGDVSALANIFAFASMIGVLDAPQVDARSADALLNLYKQAKPGDPESIAIQIERTVSQMNPELQSKFRSLANAWGRSLSAVIQNPKPEFLRQIAGKLTKSVFIMNQAMDQLANHHEEGIMRNKVTGSKLSGRLGLKAAMDTTG